MKKNTNNKILVIFSVVFLFFICIFISVSAPPISWTEHTIDSNLTGAFAVCTNDFNNDNVIDVLSTGYGMDYGEGEGEVVWYNTSDYETFTKHVIYSGDGYFKVDSGDMDGDGWIDAVVTNYPGDKVYIFENDGTPEEGNWTRHTISSDPNPGYLLKVIDIDKDSDLDVVINSPYGSRIYWCENEGAFSFSVHDVGDASGCRGLHAGDIDGDGWNDIIAGLGGGANKVYWYRNDGTPDSGIWSAIKIDDGELDSPSSVVCVDMDGDGDNDVLGASLNNGRISWFENDGTPLGTNWNITRVTDTPDEELTLATADLDNDGDMDIIADDINNNMWFWMENLNGVATSWDMHTGGTDLTHCTYVNASMFKDGGYIDVFVVATMNKSLMWYESNLTTSNENIEFISIENSSNGTTIYTKNPTINWSVVSDTSKYWLQIDNDSDFSSPEINITDINQWNYPSNCNINSTRVSFTLTEDLEEYNTYYMRVEALAKN